MTALVWCPFPDRASAEAGLAADCGALFKTDEGRLDEMVARLVALHPNESPAVLGWPCPVASTETRVWIRSVVMPGDAA